ncbi:unnamed protein product [Clonostachys rhizophaga]|uniref:Uncharacterized protein n=1 Tax=Clonostachys rhizophaga TaxID=160324 RepID=A0A9N9YLC5_9HYPO|nr:unnamed protein product [Clonostachys rhizophaga]
MSRNLTVIKELGLWCPYGGKPYICEGAYYEFVGCCKYDPCAGNDGFCTAANTTTANSTLEERLGIRLSFICRNTDYAAKLTNTWPYHVVYNPDGKNLSCIGSTPRENTDARCLPPDLNLREAIMSLGSPNGTNITEEPEPTPSLAFGVTDTPDTRSGQTWTPLMKNDIVGLSIGITVFALILLGLLGRYFWISESKKYAVSRRQSQLPENSHQTLLKAGLRQHTTSEDRSSTSGGSSGAASHQDSSNWYGDRQRLNQKNFSWYTELIWDVILTIAPTFFIVVPVLALCINNQPISSHGETLMSINRLIPTIYPILFAAVASRFYKNLGRFHLEQPDGISLAALEQIMGSQSFAGAIERLLFVRTQVPIGILILVIWAMSPLGGQGGARMINHSYNEYLSYGGVSYVHPSYQVSGYSSQEYEITMHLGVNSLYSSSLLSSPDQKLAPRDLWEMPKIPQRDKSKPRGEMHEIDKQALARGDSEYYSLIGTKIQGLDFAKQSNAVLNFTVETSYIELDCLCQYPDFNLSVWMDHPQGDPMYATFGKLRNSGNDTSVDIQFSGGLNWRWQRASWEDTNIYVPHLAWLSSRNEDEPAPLSRAKDSQIMFNCSIDTVTLETEILCDLNSTNPTCSAERQRLVDIADLKLDLLMRTMKSVGAMWNLISWWKTADGGFNNRASSPTEVYIAGGSSPYGTDEMLRWLTWDERQVSRRMTTAFNTFHMATLNPMNHTEMAFRKDPGPQKYLPLSPSTPTFYNETVGTVTTTVEVYRTDKAWTALHLGTSFVLLILAGLGLALRLLIKGPDVIGYASSMTRDNTYIPLLQDSGSVLHGPTRARLLKDLRVQLADVRPESNAGYIAFRAVPSNLQKGAAIKDHERQNDLWRPFTGDRRYV